MVKVGVIGCGSIAKLRHIPEYAANSDVKISGFCDLISERAEAMVEKYGGKLYKDYEELLADKDIDAVSVCTFNSNHASITIAAFEAGKHVLCEKPLAVSIEEAMSMIEASKKAGKYLMIGHNQRLAEGHIRAKEIIKSGELGKILSFKTTFGHSGPETWSADKGNHTWFFKKDKSCIGSLGDLGVHKADLMRWLIDDEIKEVSAFVTTQDKRNEKDEIIGVDDNAVCILKSKSGIMGTLTASWTYYGVSDNSTVLYCTNGIMKIYDDPEFPIIIHKKNKEKVFIKVQNIQTNDNQTTSGVIDLFIKSIKTNTSPEISGEEGLEALKIVMACLESSQKGVTVKI